DGVHMRQHRRAIGVLLEHHEDVHTPLLKMVLICHHWLPRRSLRDRRFVCRLCDTACFHSPRATSRSSLNHTRPHAQCSCSHPVQPSCTGARHITVAESISLGESHAFRKGKKAKRMPTTRDAVRINAKPIRSPSGRIDASPSPIPHATSHDSTKWATPINAAATIEDQRSRSTSHTNTTDHTKVAVTWSTMPVKTSP